MSSALPLDPTHAAALALPELLQFADAGIVSRTLLNTPAVRVVLFAFAAGQELTEHTNRRRALVHMLQGSCEFFYNGRWQNLSAGTLLQMPPDHPHALRANAGPCALLLTLCAEGDAAPGQIAHTETSAEANA
ncbi:MAG: cupin domain-containing protein [Opitutae bacterium]|nr:cupin domain-containing protein [Opitutae bacterium]